MPAIVSILIAVTVLAVLAYPFLKRGNRNESPGAPTERLRSADTLRHLLYREPVTLRNDYEAGNITADEYREQLNEVRLQAAELMRERDEKRYQMIEAELAIEREVQRIRRNAQSPRSDTSDDP